MRADDRGHDERDSMSRFCLTLARLCSAMWVGAGFLFVTTSVTEQVQPTFDATTKETLALIRFPWYYGTGFVLLTTGFLASRFTPLSSRPRTAAMLLLLSATFLLATDHTFVYRPLREKLAQPGPVSDVGFERLHSWSEWLNGASFLCTAVAAVILCATRERPLATPAAGRDA